MPRPSPPSRRWPPQPGRAGTMLETLRERLLSVQQDLTAGWVALRAWPSTAGLAGEGGETGEGPAAGRGGGSR